MNHKEYFKKNKISNGLNEKTLAFKISNVLLSVRLQSGYTQAQLASLIGTKQSGIARAESGEILPKLEFLLKVAKALGKKLILPNFSDNSSDIQTYSIPSPLDYYHKDWGAVINAEGTKNTVKKLKVGNKEKNNG